MRRRSLIALPLAACAVAWAPAAAPAQTPAPPPGTQPPPPAPPPAPDVVLSGRDVRMSRGGIVSIALGCRNNAGPGEACIGSITVRLASAITVKLPPPGHPNGNPVSQHISPFTFGVKDFKLVVGDATQLRLRLSRRAQELIRNQQRVRAEITANYNSRAGAQGRARRNVRVYFPSRPGS